MTKTEYILRQLARTKNKKFELYVVTRIVHLLNDSDLKFVTQQFVSRGTSGRALTDLYFPQIALHIEVDEPFHKGNVLSDKVREADIVNATDHEIVRIDVDRPIDEINERVDEIVRQISDAVDKEKRKGDFIPWDIEAEFDPKTYIDRGYIDTDDDVAFRTIKDACNCFGHNYAGYQQATASHPNPKLGLWFPKLYPNDDWDNQISSDEKTITEKCLDTVRWPNYPGELLSNQSRFKHQRLVFARVKDNLGIVLYRFRGLYKLDNSKCGKGGTTWKRIATRVKTFHQSGS